MKYLLDSNACIRLINGRSPQLRNRLLSEDLAQIVVCAVVKAELFAGAAKSQTPDVSLARQQRFLDQFQSLPFDDKSASVYATIRADLERRGTPIGPMDMLIAAIAIAYNVTFVTHNTGEFGRIKGLTIEDWEV